MQNNKDRQRLKTIDRDRTRRSYMLRLSASETTAYIIGAIQIIRDVFGEVSPNDISGGKGSTKMSRVIFCPF